MSSESDRKRRLREERQAQEQSLERRAGQRRRLKLLAASAVVAAVLVAVGILVSQTGDGGGDQGGLAEGEQLAGAASAETLFRGIPQQGAALGRPDAPVRMVEFVDLQCPFCAQYTRDVLPELVRRYVRTGKLRMELRPLAFLGEDSVEAASAVAAAADQNRMWQFVDVFYVNQGDENSGYVTPTFLRRVATGAGLNAGPVVQASIDQPTLPLLQRAQADAARYGVNSTPSFLLARRGQPLRAMQISQLETSEFSSQIDAALGG